MTDPFVTDGPTVVSFSGGRTSGYMLRRILQAHGGTLPADTHVVFANTGKERPETLAFVHECATRWDVPITWLEYTGRAGGSHGQRFRVVDFASASRRGEPFETLIRERKFVPNSLMRFCTTELKIHPIRDFMLSRGYEDWANVVGLRFDEPNRVARVRNRGTADSWVTRTPLYSAQVTEAEVLAFWSKQPFDLQLPPGDSNCDGCMLKGPRRLADIERRHPGTLAWWGEQERSVGGTFRSGWPIADIERAARLPVLPGILNDGNEPALPCACTD